MGLSRRGRYMRDQFAKNKQYCVKCDVFVGRYGLTFGVHRAGCYEWDMRIWMRNHGWALWRSHG